MLESIQNNHDLICLRLALQVTNGLTRIGSNQLRIFKKDLVLCGLRAQCFKTVLCKIFKSEGASSFIGATICLVKNKCPAKLKKFNLNLSKKGFKKYWKKEKIIDGSHALVICRFADRIYVVDPTIEYAAFASLDLLIKSAKTNKDLSKKFKKISDNYESEYLSFYKSNWFYKSINFISYFDCLDPLYEKWIKFKLKIKLI